MLLNASQRFENLVILGDLNCDIVHPDKGPQGGKGFSGLND